MPVSCSVDRDVLSFFKKIKDKSTDYINRLIVSSFVITHNLTIEKQNFLYKYLIKSDAEDLLNLIKIIKHSPGKFAMEELVEVFEFVISPADKEVNGAVYTPAFIREYIINRVLTHYRKEEWCDLLYADLSCGCGGFFYSLIKIIKRHIPDMLIAEFIRSNLLGIDIKEYSVERTKILLALYALQEGEDLHDDFFNIFCQNSLSYDFVKTQVYVSHDGIDVVIGNPPYVASSKISEENKKYLKNWEVSRTGKPDLYLTFFQIGLECLKQGGTLGYITVNTFYRSLNGMAFRNYLSSRNYDCIVVDFGAEQLFRGCSTYTCICIIQKRKTGQLHYIEASSSELTKLESDGYENIPYSILDNKKGWILKDKKTSEKIRIIENVGKPLGDVVEIKNGFATLRNDIYLIRPLSQNEYYYFFQKDGNNFQVERSICREAIKANLIRTKDDISKLKEYIIFPYYLDNGQQIIINEDDFERNYPFAYSYLNQYKEELAKRDKGHKQYPRWYAFGRSQALNLVGERLLCPHICDVPCFVHCSDITLMFYDGYAIFAKNQRELEIIRRLLMSSIFWYYITKTSKPYSGGFFSLEKRYIRNFGIPQFTEEQEEELLKIDKEELINEWLISFYQIRI